MPSDIDSAAVRIAGLAKRYGRLQVLAGVDLEVRPGEALGLVGANGAGKTTLIKCLLDLCACDAGRMELFGMPATLAAARARLAYVPERFTPPHYLRCGEFLELVLKLSGTRLERAKAGRLLAELGLESEVMDRPVRELSKGMTHKLGLAAAFLVERDLYLLDEPMSDLDPVSRLAVKSVMRRLNREAKTLFFSSHVLADVEELCSSVAVLDRGRVRFHGAPAELLARYAEPSLERAFMRCLRGDESAERA